MLVQGFNARKIISEVYCSALSLGGNVNTRRILKPDIGIHLSHKKSMKHSGQMKLLCELSKLNAFILRGY